MTSSKIDGFVKSPYAALRESFVIPTYLKVRLIPHDSQALPPTLFTKPSKLGKFSTFFEVVKIVLLVLTLILMSACGGGGGGGGSPAPALVQQTVPGLISISVTPANPSLVLGQSQQFTATGTFSDNTTRDVTKSVIWSSSATSVAVVRSDGSVTPAGANRATNSTTISAASGSISASTTLTVTGGGIAVNNVLPVSVNGALCSPDPSYPNKLCVSVTVCEPGTVTCQTINDILLDTGSYGLRIFKSALTGIALPQTTTPSGSLAECMQFGDGSSLWGAVQTAGVILGNEPAVSIPIQVIDASFGFSDSTLLPVGFGCLNPRLSPADARYNGILGVGVFTHDCGAVCETNPDIGIYFTCNGTTCSGAAVTVAHQVRNPVSALPIDNNGVILQLPAVPLGGMSSTAGNLLFGIGTRPNNTPSQVTAYGTDSTGRFSTLLNGRAYRGFVDSGSNGLFFNPPTPIAGLFPDCLNSTWYCPTSLLNLSATNTGVAPLSASGVISLQIGNYVDLNNSGNSVFAEIGGNFIGAFDWGMPFFFGRYVFVGFEGTGSSLGRGPYWAY